LANETALEWDIRLWNIYRSFRVVYRSIWGFIAHFKNLSLKLEIYRSNTSHCLVVLLKPLAHRKEPWRDLAEWLLAKGFEWFCFRCAAAWKKMLVSSLVDLANETALERDFRLWKIYRSFRVVYRSIWGFIAHFKNISLNLEIYRSNVSHCLV